MQQFLVYKGKFKLYGQKKTLQSEKFEENYHINLLISINNTWNNTNKLGNKILTAINLQYNTQNAADSNQNRIILLMSVNPAQMAKFMSI